MPYILMPAVLDSVGGIVQNGHRVLERKMGCISLIWITPLFSTKSRMIAWKIFIGMAFDRENADKAVTNHFVMNFTSSAPGYKVSLLVFPRC